MRFFKNIFGNLTDLHKRILFALGALIVYRIGSFIPLPGVNASAVLHLFNGENYKGFRFVYENGLYEYHKSRHPYLFEMCDLFNNGKSVKEIALMRNISTTKVYASLIAGTNMGICSYKKICCFSY